MRIPNKFNGYSRDGVRLYRDPATIVATIGSMEEAATVATAAETAAAATTAAEAAAAETAAQQAAAEAAAQQAGQAGIMQGGAATPPPAGAPGLGAPMPPAEPLPPVEPLPPATDPGITQANELGRSQVEEAFNRPDLGQNLQRVGPDLASLQNTPFGPQELADPIASNPFTTPVNTTVADAGIKAAPELSTNPFIRGAQNAFDVISNGAKAGYEAYKTAPAPLQYLGAGMAAKKYLFAQPSSGPKEYKGPHPDFSNFTPSTPSPYLYGANGGIMQSYAEGGVPTSGGPVEQMSNMNANSMGGNMMYPMSQQHTNVYGTGVNQRPMSVDMLTDGANNVDPYTGEQHNFAEGGLSMKDYQHMSGGRSGTELEDDIAQAQHVMAKAKGNQGLGVVPRGRGTANMSALHAAMSDLGTLNKKAGIKATPMAMVKMPDYSAGGADDTEYAAGGGIMYNLGGYSDGGRLLKGPGDGVSDSIPAQIGHKQPARLADGEFVVPARIVSELGNGSTEAGARQLYAMMDRVQHSRKKSIGKGKVAVNSKANKHLPA